ncbi:MAG: thiamine-phosphate kinase [Corynebacterium sp.]|nr:thiamine-phosphate kinase [Corynebacterium sp.]
MHVPRFDVSGLPPEVKDIAGLSVEQAGEAALISAITALAPSTVNGDDAAVFDAMAPNSRAVASTDTLVQNRHFRLDWSTPQQIGQKAVVQNYADIESMGARPIGALLSISAPGEMDVDTVLGIVQGVSERAAYYNTELVGGDLTRASTLVITITAIGALGGNRPPLQLDRARAGQKVVAHGRLGWSAAGFALLEKYGPIAPERSLQSLIAAHLTPTLTPSRGLIARAAGATAMTDNSDGLVKDLTTMARRSNVRINLHSDAIAPCTLLRSAGELLGVDPWEWVLGGGEDHTLLGTTDKAAPSGFRVIGDVTRASEPHVTVDNKPPSFVEGWESF